MYFTFLGQLSGDYNSLFPRGIYLLISALSYFSFFKVEQAIQSKTLFHGSGINRYIGFLVSILIAKLVYFLVLIVYDVGRLLFSVDSRHTVVVFAVALLSFVILLLLIYGSTFGKYNYKVERIDLKFKNLPSSFDGFKIVQISDMHLGSYDNNKGLLKGIEKINQQEPDLILFTGDMVNDHKEEVTPYIADLKKIKAKYGCYAVLGNHDYYGAYRQQDKKAYWQDFFNKFDEIGFRLLNNESATIHIDEDSINIVGSENWGSAGWAPKRGDLQRAFVNVNPDDFCILLTHDPSHWDQEVLALDRKVPLTLSGHTHGFQFGINWSFFKWSPAQYSYPRWIGLYEEQGQQLYVNRGFGYIAYPGRVGMRPEVTVISLHSA